MNSAGPHGSQKQNRTIQSLLVVLIVAGSFGVFWFFVSYSGVNANERAGLDGMLSGEAHRPFVTRVLVPWLINGTAALLPESASERAITAVETSSFLTSLLEKYQAPHERALEGLISLGWQLAGILGFAFTLRALVRKVYQAPELFPELVTISGLAALAPMLLFGYIYDLPNLFLTTLGLYCIVSGMKIRYHLVFVLGLLNKETAIVLIVPAVLLAWDFPRPVVSKILTSILIQIGIFAAVRVPINMLYRDNPGGAFEVHLLDHLDVWVNYPVIGIVSVLAAIGMLWLVFSRWRQKPAAAVLGALPGLGLLVLFVISGIPFEIRVFYEVYSAGYLCILATITARKSPLESRIPTMQEWLQSLPLLFGRKTIGAGERQL
ncbi:MAG: hypothetical protein ACYC6H_04725 [Bellilinea sp.]